MPDDTYIGMATYDLMQKLNPITSADDACERIGLSKLQSAPREIVTFYYNLHKDDPASMAAMAIHVRGSLEKIRVYGRNYYAGKMPDAVVCAYLLHIYGLDQTRFKNQHADVIAAFRMIQQSEDIRPDGLNKMNDARDSSHRDATFFGMIVLQQDLTGLMEELKRPTASAGEMAAPTEYEAYAKATGVIWPTCEISIDNALLASRVRRALTSTLAGAYIVASMGSPFTGPRLVWDRDAQSSHGHQSSTLHPEDRAGRKTPHTPGPAGGAGAEHRGPRLT